MKKLFLDIKKHPLAHIICSIVSLAIGFTVFALFYFWIRKFSIVGAVDGTGVAGAALIGVFGLAWLSRQGTFDFMTYGFNQALASMFNKQANKYHDMVEYKEQKNISREQSGLYYFSFLFVGLLHLIAFGVLEIILHTLY